MARSRQPKSSSSSSSSETEIFVKKVHNKKKSSHKSSPSEIEYYSNDKKSSHKSEKCKPKHNKHSSESEKCKPKHKKHSSESEKSERCKPKHKKHSSESESETERCKPKRKHHSSESDSDSDEKCSFDDIYKYYKYKLLSDDSLLAGGSNAYLSSANTTIDVIPQGYPIPENSLGLMLNVEQPPHDNAIFFVRESGTYLFFYVLNSDQSAQIALYVNGLVRPLTRSGNNSGAGQLLVSGLIKLNKDDSIIVRNDNSTVSAVTSKLYNGGLNIGNDSTFSLIKIAPYNAPEFNSKWDVNCLSRRNKYLFKKLADKMVLDKELMVKGFNVHGCFYSKIMQTINVESDVVWDNAQNVNGVLFNPSGSDPTQIQILEEGVYRFFCELHVEKPSQIAFVLNGVPIQSSVQGTNKGASLLTARLLLKCNAGDIISVRNHTSAQPILLTTNAGGGLAANSAILTFFKIAPLVAPVINKCKLSDYHKKCFSKFREYLLNSDCYNVQGSSSYWLSTNATSQVLAEKDTLAWNTINVQENVSHVQGKDTFVIKQDGIYDIYCDVLFDQAAQITMFVNGIPDVSTISGRDSGGGKVLLRQMVKLMKGDVLTFVNYSSTAVQLTSSINAGGTGIGQNAFAYALRLSAIDDECHKSWCASDNKKEKKEKKEEKDDKKEKKEKK